MQASALPAVVNAAPTAVQAVATGAPPSDGADAGVSTDDASATTGPSSKDDAASATQDDSGAGFAQALAALMAAGVIPLQVTPQTPAGASQGGAVSSTTGASGGAQTLAAANVVQPSFNSIVTAQTPAAQTSPAQPDLAIVVPPSVLAGGPTSTAPSKPAPPATPKSTVNAATASVDASAQIKGAPTSGDAVPAPPATATTLQPAGSVDQSATASTVQTTAVPVAPLSGATTSTTAPLSKTQSKSVSQVAAGADAVASPAAKAALTAAVAASTPSDGSSGDDHDGQADNGVPQTNAAAAGSTTDPGAGAGVVFVPTAATMAVVTPTTANPAIVSQIANQIAKTFDGKSTRFDIALDPAGLGHVNVRLQIDANGQISASLSFDNPHAAADAKSQAGHLQQALEQAGFNIAQSGLSFDVSGQGAGFAGQNAQAQQSSPSAAPTPSPTLDDVAAISSAAATRSRPASGVDITI